MSPSDIVDFRDTVAVEAITPAWHRLAWETAGSSYFQSPEWVRAWWEHLADRPETRVAVWRDRQNDLEAVAAMSRRSERLHRKLRVPVTFWTNAGSGPGAADHTGFPALPGRTSDVAGWLATLDGSVLIRNAAPTSAAAIPAGARAVEESPCPRLSIPAGDEPIGRSSKFRKRLRRNSRMLRERGIEFRAVAGPDISAFMLNRLMDLHEARGEAMSWSTTFTPARIGFHRQLIEGSDPGRGPGIMLAETPEQIVGILYGFWWRDTFSYFQTGWDPSWWELSLGTALVYEMILHARSAGARVFDFLRGPEDYKYRFGAEDLVDRTWLLPRGASGKLLEAKARAG